MRIRTWLIGGCISLAIGVAQAAENYPVELRAQWLPAAEQGDAEAQFSLGKSYCCGYGSSYDTSKALHWMCKAGKQGHVEAQYEMGRQLEATTDTDLPFMEQHFIWESYVWYSQAAEQGHELAELYRRKLDNSFSKQQKRYVRTRAAEWQESKCDQYTG